MNALFSGTRLLHHLHTDHPFLQQWPPPPPPPTVTPHHASLSSQNPSHFSLIRHSFCARSRRRWDSNAESFRTQKFNFDSQGYNDNDDDDDDEEDEEEDTGFRYRRRRRSWWSDDSVFDVLDEFFDSVWIFKVFRSYGWALPFIIASLLLANGPKAFLMALALPLGQSAFSLAFEKLQERTQKRPKRKSRTKRKSRARTANAEFDEETAEQDGTRIGKMGYRSWVPRDDILGDAGGQDLSGFGGWDELEKQREFEMASRKRSAQKVGKFGKRASGEKWKLGRRVGRSEMPLLLRLLIAVFPFLSSWTRMF